MKVNKLVLLLALGCYWHSGVFAGSAGVALSTENELYKELVSFRQEWNGIRANQAGWHRDVLDLFVSIVMPRLIKVVQSGAFQIPQPFAVQVPNKEQLISFVQEWNYIKKQRADIQKLSDEKVVAQYQGMYGKKVSQGEARKFFNGIVADLETKKINYFMANIWPGLINFFESLVVTKLKNRLSEPAIKTALAKVLTRYEHEYPFQNSKNFAKKTPVIQKYSEELINVAMDAVKSLGVTRDIMLPLVTEHIIAMQQGFTIAFGFAIRGLAERMLNELMQRMNQSKKPSQSKASQGNVFQVERYTAGEYIHELQTANSELSLDLETFITQYVWAYDIAAQKEVVTTQYAKELINDLVLPYVASQEDEMQVIPVVANYINTQRENYMQRVTQAMGDLVNYIKAQPK